MQVYSTDSIRNVVLVSHSGAGKTTFAEAMLFATGALSRMGQVADGNTVSDYEPEEIERRSSIQTSIVPCEWKGKKINLLDTPGYADFTGEMLGALTAADMALLLVGAVDAVQVGTETAWRQVERLGLPTMIVISKLDRENANFFTALEKVQEIFGRKCVAAQAPKGSPISGVVDLMDPKQVGEDPQVAKLREKLVEAAAEADDALTEKYLDKGDLTPEELAKGFRAGFLKGTLVPVLASAAAAQQAGATQTLELLAQFGPSPAERPPVEGKDGTGKATALKAEKAPLAVRVFKTTADPYVGKLSYLRILSGTLTSDSQVWNVNKGQVERVGQVFVPRGKAQEAVPSLSPGDVGAVAKLQYTSTGDTLCQREKPVTLPHIEFPKPVYSVAIAPKTKTDMDKMGASLARLVEEDPSLHVTRHQDTSETVLGGLGDAHIDVACKKLKRKFGVDVLVSTPSIPYRETISHKAQAEYKHKKQSGGHGQYGHVFLDLEPLPRGSGVEFAVKVVGGSVPREYFPAVEKGVMEGVQQGVLSGSPVVDVRITLTDGSSHPVDSSGIAFQIAGVQAFKKGIQQANPVLLEPIMKVQVTVPDQYTGDIMGDLSSKRARVGGSTPGNGWTTIEAQAPLAEMQRYATDLRSLTGGRGVYTMEFSHYEPVPAHLAQKVIEERQKGQAKG